MIIKLRDLKGLRRRLKSKRIVYAGGAFDLMHTGHIQAFKDLRKFADVTVVGISTDARIRQRKGPKRPILGERERLRLIAAIRYVDYCFIAPQPKAPSVPTMEILRQLRPDVFVSADKRWLAYRSEVKNLGVRLVISPRNKINSTSRVIGIILNRYCLNKLALSSLHKGDGVRRVRSVNKHA